MRNETNSGTLKTVNKFEISLSSIIKITKMSQEEGNQQINIP